jgi:branched-chain amino acid transport system ATP-binding protein
VSVAAQPLVVEGLTVGYIAEPVLENISFEVSPGEVLAVLGPNGVGKTTMLKAICGLREAWSGSVRYGDRRLDGMTAEARARVGISLVPEGRRLFRGMSVRDNLLTGSFTGRSGDLDEVLGLFPSLAQRLEVHAGMLSGGEQQMLAIGRALMGDLAVLLIDEPSLGLAPILVNTVFSTFGGLAEQGRAVVVAEQNVIDATRVADRCLVVDQGRIVFEGPSTTADEQDAIRTAYASMLEMAEGGV